MCVEVATGTDGIVVAKRRARARFKDGPEAAREGGEPWRRG